MSLSTHPARFDQHSSIRGPPRHHHGKPVHDGPQYGKDQPLQLAPPSNRNAVIDFQNDRRKQLDAGPATVGRGGVDTSTTMVGFPKHSSSSRMQDLNRIGFSKMFVGRTHVGYYLLCRIVTKCTRMVAIHTVVEDPDGAAFELSIYNFPTTFCCPLQHVDGLFWRGAIIAIREPTFKAQAQGTFGPFLRVDSPTDIVLVPSNSNLLNGIRWRFPDPDPRALSTAEQWQQRGTAYYNNSQWFLAAIAFSHALALGGDAASLVMNRAAVYIQLEYYSGAITDLEWVMAKGGISGAAADKALLRLAKARCGRGEFRAAAEDYLRWKRKHPDDTSADSAVERCRARIQEEQTGNYDWACLFQTAKERIRVDVADFIGPVEVRRLQNRGGGRGMVASRNLKTGELLLAVKPFVSIFAADLPPKQVIIAFDLLSKSSREPTDSLLLARVVEKLYGNPDLHDQIFHLYAGPNYPPPPHTYPPPPTRPSEVDFFDPKAPIDIAKLEAICTYNNFCPFRLDGPREEREAKPTALYTLPSMFNHSCLANAIWYCIGDLMVVRAAEPIPAGTEITIPYSVEESYLDRSSVLRRHMLQSCSCRLCEDDRRDGETQNRRRHELKARLDPAAVKAASPADVRALEKEISATYAPSRGPVRPCSALALHAVAEKLRESKDPRHLQEAVRYDLQALERYGFIPARSSRGLPFTDDRIPTAAFFIDPAEIMLDIAHTYLALNDEANAARWLKAALWLTDTSVGGGKQLFMMIHAQMLHQLGIESFATRVL